MVYHRMINKKLKSPKLYINAWLARMKPVKKSIEMDFDYKFYRMYYKDLTDFNTPAELENHFREYGLKEGRIASLKQMIKQLEIQHGPLPDDFNADEYRFLNSDLKYIHDHHTLINHYLQFGRKENRNYSYNIASYEDEYTAYLQQDIAIDRSNGRPDSKTFRKYLRKEGVTSVYWLSRFNFGEFILLNSDWLDQIPQSRIEALCTFARDGIKRLAPISYALRFDPAFYQEAPGAPVKVDNAELYRHWLNIGMAHGEAGSEDALLRSLIGEDAFPTCFQVEAYRAAVLGVTELPSERARVLAHYFQVGFSTGVRGIVLGAGSARFYAQLGWHLLNGGQNALALEAFERAVNIEPDNGPIRHGHGDALRALGRSQEALDDFLFAAGQPEATVWSHIHAAEGLAFLRDDTDSALSQIATSAPQWCGAALWREAARRVVARAFEGESRRTHALYLAGRRDEADAQTAKNLSRLTEVMIAANPLPAPLPQPLDGPVVIVANRDLPQCDHYRVIQKYQQLITGGWEVEIYDQAHPEAYRAALDRARLVIFYRVAANPDIIHAMLYVSALGISTIYEIDDLIFDHTVYPDPWESFEGQISLSEYASLQQGVPLFRHAIGLCDVGLASTPALAEALRPLVRNGICHVLRNGLDGRNLPYLNADPVPLAPNYVTIFYGSGTKAHNRDFTEFAAPALLAALARHPQVRLVLAGHLRLDDRFASVASRVHRLDFVTDVDAYWEVLSGVDINLAVLAPGKTTDAKSEIKWLEAAVCAVPSIVSATRTYQEILIDGEDVLFADSPETWSAALERLIANPELRHRIGLRARDKVCANYSLAAAAETLRTFLPIPMLKPMISSAIVQPDLSVQRIMRTKPRILLVNVFFPPQTIGGATRVIRDNVDYFINHAASDLDLAVVTTDDGVEKPYQTRFDSYRGIPVYRIAAPRLPQMGWRPFDPEMRSKFEAILERFDPDLVHFHCIQHLTGSVVEAVKARGTRYVITLHDAWWISDFQFLIDKDDQIRWPTADPLASGADPAHGLTHSIARRRQLGRLLDGAQAQLAVSEAFADLHRKAGYTRTRALPNGVSPFGPVPRAPRQNDRIHLGHIGNRSAHKGASLVEAVLRQTPYRHLSLIMVEHAREPGYESEEIWGTTPVRIVGRVPQESIANLYAELDVLLAPSLWPESFGLVTREAQVAGLWVVASDRGAIGSDIRNGVDGYRIDVSTLDGLRSVLTRIDENPELYRVSPPAPKCRIRSADDQGADLLELYQELLRDKLRR